MTTAEEALNWLANLPPGVQFRYLGPYAGGYSCVLWVGKRPWYKGGGPEHIVEGESDCFDDPPTPFLAIRSALFQLTHKMWRKEEF